ncbi:hypothetical protein DFH11DRAFT_281539 [Phellopilus nigrolimitatus]|nr:hypothetical protein DFH11DRAFT_281539 [Phellopilus nigrolimitatus]
MNADVLFAMKRNLEKEQKDHVIELYSRTNFEKLFFSLFRFRALTQTTMSATASSSSTAASPSPAPDRKAGTDVLSNTIHSHTEKFLALIEHQRAIAARAASEDARLARAELAATRQEFDAKCKEFNAFMNSAVTQVRALTAERDLLRGANEVLVSKLQVAKARVDSFNESLAQNGVQSRFAISIPDLAPTTITAPEKAEAAISTPGLTGSGPQESKALEIRCQEFRRENDDTKASRSPSEPKNLAFEQHRQALLDSMRKAEALSPSTEEIPDLFGSLSARDKSMDVDETNLPAKKRKL